MRFIPVLLTTFLLAGAALAPPAGAQIPVYSDPDSTGYTLGLNFLVQTFVRVQDPSTAETPNGFRLRRVRLRAGGQAHRDLAYVVQIETARSPSILDARLTWTPDDRTALNVGLYKVPFSLEFLESVTRIDFTDRSRVVRTLAPNRQVGASLRSTHLAPLTLQVGAFNGVPRLNNDNNLLLYVARAGIDVGRDDTRLMLAANAGLSRDDNLSVGGVDASFTGSRRLLGADFDLRHGPAILKGEYIHARLDPEEGSTRTVSGLYLTAGFTPAPGTQAFARWDRFDAGNGATDVFLVGSDWYPTPPLRLQLSAAQPLGDLDARGRYIEGLIQLAL